MPSHFKYWIGEDGVARIRKEDMPKPLIPEIIPAIPPEIGIRIELRSNPLFAQLKAEVKAITGNEEIIIVKEPDEAPANGK